MNALDHATVVKLIEHLTDLCDRLERDVPAHACPGFDRFKPLEVCPDCARPSTADARALLDAIEEIP